VKFLNLELAWKYVLGRKRAMTMSLFGIVLGIAFFVITQAQTSGFEAFFIRTILGTNGAIRISDSFQDMHGSVRMSSQDGKTKFLFNSREGTRYTEGVENPALLRSALSQFSEISGISEILEGKATLAGSSRSQNIEIHGIVPSAHMMVSDIENQIIQGQKNI
jgi:lipoprotein-releasing system permease protein